jgi:uncharacterized membrane protein (TIGR02234 family)
MSGPGPRPRRRERFLVGLVVVLGAALMLLAVSRTWAHAVVQDPLAGRLSVDATGRQAAPIVAAVALVALAGAVAVLTLRTVGRVVAGLLLVLSGAAAMAAAVDVGRTPTDALRSVVADVTGRSGEALPLAQRTPWPWVALVGALLVVAGGAAAVVRARAWASSAGLPGRYDSPVGGAPSTGDGRPAAPAGADERAAEAGVPDTWERLSRGEDPTE